MRHHQWKTLLADVASDFGKSWRQLAIVHLFYGAIAMTVLTPLTTVLLQLFVSASGESALSDFDIAFFFLRPVGLLAAVVVGAVALTILVLELAVLMVIGFGASCGRPVGYRDALVSTFRQAPRVLRTAAEMVARSLLTATPFLAAGWLVYSAMLGEHDINYYLARKPPAFWIAGGLMGGLLAGMAVLLLKQFSGWSFALPMLLFANVPPRSALGASRQLTAGNYRVVVPWLVAWLAASSCFASVSTGIIGGLGRLAAPIFAASHVLLIIAVGVFVMLAAVVNYMVTFVNVSVLGLLIVRLFRASGHQTALPASAIEPTVNDDPSAGWRLTGRQLVWGSLVAVIAASVVGGTILRGIRLEDTTEIIAHRGASAAAPENTLAAVRQAIADGADWVEIDVQETADGEVVVFHDSDLKKAAGVSLRIRDATLAQLGEIDIGSRFHPEFAAERVPTLDQVLDLCRGKIGVNIELKYYGHNERLEERVVQIVESKAMADDVVLMSLDYRGIRKIRGLRPDWTVGLLSSVTVGDVTKLDLDFLAVNARTLSPAFVQSAQGNGKRVLVWTVNDALGMSQMMSRGVDGIITDEPALAVQVLEFRAGLSPPERLLFEAAGIFGITPNYGEQ